MGSFVSILLSRQNLYYDTSDSDTLSIEYKPSNENNNEFTLSTGSTNYEWHIYNIRKRYTKDNGMEILA